MEEEKKITKQDYQNVLERYLYQKFLNEDDIRILKDSPYCTCEVLSDNPGLAERFQNHLKKMVENLRGDLSNLPNYVVIDSEETTEWYHPEFEGFVPTLQNVKFTQIRDCENNVRIIYKTPYEIEKFLLDEGYELIRYDYARCVYYKKEKNNKC